MCNYLINKIILKLVSAEDNQTAGQRGNEANGPRTATGTNFKETF